MADHGRISQLPVEAVLLPAGVMGRVSQLPVEVVMIPAGVMGQISQLPVEVVMLATPTVTSRNQTYILG